MTLAELLASAELVLSSRDASPNEIINKISEYCEQFAAWQAENGAHDNRSLPSKQAELLAELSSRNAAIIELAESLQAETGRGINEFKKKARGLRAYSGILPGGIGKIWKGTKG